MAYKISDECISCGACEMECPNEAISEGETTYVIDPVDAPGPDPDRRESKEELQAKYDRLHS